MERAERQEPDERPRTRGQLAFVVVAGLVGIAILCGLGTWQVQRLAWKEGILKQIAERTHSAPQSLSEVAGRYEKTGDVEYWPVQATGRFLNSGERYFLSTHEGQAGWNVYTPLLLPGDRMIFVNRGFVPYEMKDPAKRPQGEVEGEVTVTGLARDPQTEKPGWETPDNDPKQNVFFWRNVNEMAAGLALPAGVRVLPFFIDAGPGRAPGGYPIGGTTVIDIPNNHLQYAFTWFGLAAVLAVMLTIHLVRVFRNRKA